MRHRFGFTIPHRAALGILGALLVGMAPTSLIGPAPAQADPAAFMSVDEIRPGMTGVGYSVFSGRGMESFAVEIIEIMRKNTPGRDLILAQLDSEVVNEAGIIAGMSGSPVYIDGRLIGAVAYGWSFSKRPIAGITPIEEMLAVMDLPDAPPVGVGEMPGRDMPMPALPDDLRDAPSPAAASAELHPLRVPVMVSGISPEGAAVLTSGLAGMGLDVMQGAGGGDAGDGDGTYSLGPGDPVSIPLVRGDASIAVFGTITYADEDRLVAFGHPVFHSGGQRMPMAPARVLTVLPSQVQSFKFSSAAEPVGYFYSDRSPGAAGRIGDPPPMMPVTMTLVSPESERVFEFDIARDRFLTPQLLQSVAVSTVTSDRHRSGMGTLYTDVTVRLSDGTEIRHRDVTATLNAADYTGFLTAGPLAQLINNPFTESHIERVDVRAEIVDEVRLLLLEHVEVLEREVIPGETLHVRLQLRPYRGELVEHEIELAVPASLEPGPAVMMVCDRVSLEEWDRERAPDKYRPRNFGEFLDAMSTSPSNNQIEARLFSAGSALVVAGREMPALPPSVQWALMTPRVTGARSQAEGVQVAASVIEVDEHVLGCHTLPLKVEER